MKTTIASLRESLSPNDLVTQLMNSLVVNKAGPWLPCFEEFAVDP